MQWEYRGKRDGEGLALMEVTSLSTRPRWASPPKPPRTKQQCLRIKWSELWEKEVSPTMSNFIIGPSTIYSKKEQSGILTGCQKFLNLTSELVLQKRPGRPGKRRCHLNRLNHLRLRVTLRSTAPGPRAGVTPSTTIWGEHLTKSSTVNLLPDQHGWLWARQPGLTQTCLQKGFETARDSRNLPLRTAAPLHQSRHPPFPRLFMPFYSHLMPT